MDSDCDVDQWTDSLSLPGGVTGSLMGQVPYGVLVFGSYEIYKQKLQKRYPNARPMGIFAMASLLGDLTGSLCLCPSEIIKQKMQAGMFRTEREAFRCIWKTKGLFGFYEGYTGGLVRDLPFRAAQLVCTHVLLGSSVAFMDT
jgi:solute carrier family 25 (mitochondrial S-adenosylmethionine transporter), member 26